MKSTLILTAISLLAAAAHGSVVELGSRQTDGYVQNPSGTASFTFNKGCATAACGKTVTGFATAINQLTFGSETGLGAGDACGRCFKVTGDKDPFSANFTGPFNSISPLTLCGDSGAPEAFFPSGRGALTGTYEEVPCSQWIGTDGPNLWEGACLDGENACLLARSGLRQ
ncbi:endoglucanase V-like protein [Lactarius pseudohatsudake]|nr:endoglucanase V-like protein [Lactarius pseudohatsudake]